MSNYQNVFKQCLERYSWANLFIHSFLLVVAARILNRRQSNPASWCIPAITKFSLFIFNKAVIKVRIFNLCLYALTAQYHFTCPLKETACNQTHNHQTHTSRVPSRTSYPAVFDCSFSIYSWIRKPIVISL